MNFMGISFNMINKTHIDQLDPLDKLLAYIALDNGIFYDEEHGEIFECDFYKHGGLLKLLNELKASNYVDNAYNSKIWFLTKIGANHIRQIATEKRLDPNTVYFRHNVKLHNEAKQKILEEKNIDVDYFWIWQLG